jgi:hypothetical protein
MEYGVHIIFRKRLNVCRAYGVWLERKRSRVRKRERPAHPKQL